LLSKLRIIGGLGQLDVALQKQTFGRNLVSNRSPNVALSFLKIRHDHQERRIVFYQRPGNWDGVMVEDAECLEKHRSVFGMRDSCSWLSSDFQRPFDNITGRT